MENNPQERSETSLIEASPKRFSRRAFAITAIGACGAVALWSLHRSSPATVEAGTNNVSPGPVTIVQFSADGKRGGKVTVPRTIKSEAEWKQQLSPMQFEVTRHAGTERAYSGDTIPGTIMIAASTAAFVVTRLFSVPIPSSNPAPAGRASGSRSRPRTSWRSMTRV